MQYSSSISVHRSTYGTGLSGTGGRNIYFRNQGKTIQIHTSDQVHATTSFPVGYRAGMAILLPLIDGGISGRISTQIETSADIIGYGLIDGTLTITISTSADGDLLANISGVTTISISTSGAITATGYISGTLDIGAQPSADDIAQAVWQMQLPGGFEVGSAGKILSAAGAAGDPWSTILPGTYTGEQAGKILADLETLIKQVKALTSAGL
jgi:hypothetical protein